MMNRQETLDYASNSYVNIFSNYVVLYVHGEKVDKFDTFSDAFNYFMNNYCM